MRSERVGKWACTTIPDERAALEAEIARLQDENVKLEEGTADSWFGRYQRCPVRSPAKPEAPELKLPSDAEIDKILSFEKVWRRLIDIARTVQKDAERKN